MTRRWGLQSAMTATYVAVTAGAVLLTELVIFGMAALTPQSALTPVQVQGLAEATAAQMAAKLGVTVTADGSLPSTNIGLPGAPVSPGQARPDGNGELDHPADLRSRLRLGGRVVRRRSCHPTARCSRPRTRPATRWAASAQTPRRARRARC